jgi:glycerol-3-phosphate dehydrogenase
MKRDLKELASNFYDVAIIGGGIYGACVAWDAALRGLRVCLVEKSDFSAGTSANSLKIIHGGLRYLQHAEFKRMRESVGEQRTLMRIAPHLVHPLPVLIPTYGHGWRSKEVLSLAFLVNWLIAFESRFDRAPRLMPRSHTISKGEVLRLAPGIDEKGLTGGAVFYDAQVYNSERLIISILRAADKAGLSLANYVEVTGFLKRGDRVSGIEVKDVLTENSFHIRAKSVVNTSGPWVNRLLGFLTGYPTYRVVFAKAINLITRQLVPSYAVGIISKNGCQGGPAPIDKGQRFLFVAPWRAHSLIGTFYAAYDGDPDDLKVSNTDIRSFLDQVNRAYPGARLTTEDVSFVHGGLVPGVHNNNSYVQLARKHHILDHHNEELKGIISVVGVKYTTARHVAEKVIDRVFQRWSQRPPNSISSMTPVYGGRIEQFDGFLQAQIEKRPHGLAEDVIRRLVYNYGCGYSQVLNYFDRYLGEYGADTDRLALVRAEVLHGIRDEMAQKLTDVIFRRTELGTAGHPGNDVLNVCADIMSAELGWSPARTQQELQEVHAKFAFAR